MITTKKGFYIGDICYVMKDELYYGYWQDVQDFNDGEFQNVLDTGFGFAVNGTYGGDGCYEDNKGHDYNVDAGVIGIVPLELIEFHGDMDSITDGHVIRFEDGQEHTAKLDYDNGTFYITIDHQPYIEIYTGPRDDEDDDDYY